MTEEWRRIPGFPDYSVSTTGRVFSFRRETPRELAGSCNQRGYRMVQMRATDGSITLRTVHRLVALAFLGPPPDGMQIRHLDGDKANNSVANLTYGTASENMRDQVTHGVHNMARKTHCPQDHPYDKANTYLSPAGRRLCRACHRTRSRRSTAA